jgi:hypothetical protein
MTPELLAALKALYDRWAYVDDTEVGRFTARAMRQCADELNAVVSQFDSAEDES